MCILPKEMRKMKLGENEIALIEKVIDNLEQIAEFLEVETKLQDLTSETLALYIEAKNNLLLLCEALRRFIDYLQSPSRQIFLPIYLETFRCPECKSRSIAVAGKRKNGNGYFEPTFKCLNCQKELYTFIQLVG